MFVGVCLCVCVRAYKYDPTFTDTCTDLHTVKVLNISFHILVFHSQNPGYRSSQSPSRIIKVQTLALRITEPTTVQLCINLFV